VSENRKEEGLLLDAPVGDNITITIWKRLRHWLSRRINPTAERAIARDLARSLAIKCAGLGQATRYLSGGNQQKVCMAKWLAADCDILIIDEPTVGVDIGAKEQIHRLIWDLAGVQGKAVILISSDLLEIIKLASRILVFRDKRIVGEIGGLDAPNRAVGEISQAIGQFLN
jgi:ribose transport system ATP-binding protein